MVFLRTCTRLCPLPITRGPIRVDALQVTNVDGQTSLEEMHDCWLGGAVLPPARAARKQSERMLVYDDDLGEGTGRKKRRGLREKRHGDLADGSKVIKRG